MGNDFQKRHTACANALDSCGIGHDVGEKFREGHAAIAEAAKAFTQHASGQLTYNLLTNAPCGVDIGGDAARHAVERGHIAALAGLIQWDIYEARRLAAELLEDVNDHDEAAKLFALAKGE